ncbi:lytic transglycosylase domain-containing protein [Arenibacterium halophilum]|uniref:Lytic transglycosylase domain-containing protein n=1 Tax=Arenibacterium halophilum TaxID=2583821 RepID=A0ABY2XFD2_9RHOB|nr:lytic transglycosylase domain-containing protein [Arenibacterium halophilum]TMV15341.1 lytic transglycosylase domain-containing protein [Arenibacterium halophilum]
MSSVRPLLLLLVALALGSGPAPGHASDALARGMDLMRKAEWSAARETAGRDGAVAADVIEWHRLRAGQGTAAEVNAFLARRPDWPGLDWLRRKSEPAIAAAGRDVVLAFFAGEPPQTPEGVLAHANALIAAGQKGDGEAALVMAWRTMAMGAATQAAYLAGHGALLKPHHAARLDRLLWDSHMESSGRMLPLVSDGERALGEARIALHEQQAGVDGKIAAVPAALQDSPGLAYDRFVWRDRKGRDDDAITLLLERSKSAKMLGEPAAWATRRLNLARSLMRKGDARRAYLVASMHFTTPEAGYVHADLEWLSGFIAMRMLDNPAAAVDHFRRFDAAVDTPISKGRAGYWLGRAHEALGQKEKAAQAYAIGAKFQTSFYGLLAAERAGLPFDSSLQEPPATAPWRDAAFTKSSVLQAGLMMLAADEPDLGERFLTHLVESLDEQAALQLGQMALDLDRPHLAVMIAKRAARAAQVLYGAYYPVHPVGRMDLPMAPEMTLAIARRESEFDPKVVSGAGARGLMQVMPATAKAVAGQLGILSSHDTGRLTSEWRYNAKLGTNYLAKLAGELGGNVVMMSAGYNAGPSRPLRWMAERGDPRSTTPKGDDEIVDWIEMIPFNETRNYVMRVTESLPVYRARLGKDPLPIPFSAELTGATLIGYAP